MVSGCSESRGLLGTCQVTNADVRRHGIIGAGREQGAREQGFTLAALMVIMAVLAILLTVTVQSATFAKQREKEEELIFRGTQIVEAIRLYRARNGRFPNQLLELAEARPRVLRKAWQDPVTERIDWVPVFLGQEGGDVTRRGTDRRPPRQGPFPDPTPTPAGGDGGYPSTEAKGPIIGVHSRSCAKSIKILDGRTRYCDWKFVFDPKKLGPQQGGTPPPQPTPTPQQIR